MSTDDSAPRERWARLRFAVVGHLLENPPAPGELRAAIAELAKETWRHPTQDRRVQFGASTIERWYYAARKSNNPIESLVRQVRADAGANRAMSPALLGKLQQQFEHFSTWSYQLHSDNLAALVLEEPGLGAAPSYTTVRRRMQERGWFKRRGRIRTHPTPGQQLATQRLEQRDVRSYEVSAVHALWHLDFHDGSRRVVGPDGAWHTPQCLAIMDDCSRLCCHIQWYLHETTEVLSHGVQQAFIKRGLPRAILSDNGSAMLAGEFENGLLGHSITHPTTLPYSPYQNGKQEKFWDQLEGRLLAMLKHVEPLTLEFLNLATQAWVEQEYHRCRHEELGMSPVERMLQGPEQSRPCPQLDVLRLPFTLVENRTQRRSDGTLSVAGVRFEVPSHLRNLSTVRVRYRRWDLSEAFIVDPRHETKVVARIVPLDKARNADGRRARLPESTALQPPTTSPEPVPPLLRKLLAEYAATGLPPAYIHLNETPKDEPDDT